MFKVRVTSINENPMADADGKRSYTATVVPAGVEGSGMLILPIDDPSGWTVGQEKTLTLK